MGKSDATIKLNFKSINSSAKNRTTLQGMILKDATNPHYLPYIDM